MKKIFISLLIIILAVFFTACGEKKQEKNDDTAAPDWRNSIEYEGSFFVSRERKLLYALDKGKIVLWDNGGNGSVLQTLEYDTSVADAIDRMETDDVNSDGFADIRMLYSEKEGNAEYSLWLWKDDELKFTECRAYRFIPNPVTADEGKVKSSLTIDGFGTLERVYAFNSENEPIEKSFIITDADEIAGKIGKALIPDYVSFVPADGNATVEECSCPAYVLSDKSGNPAFLAYSDSGAWYIDRKCIGIYRSVTFDAGKYGLGEYVGEAGSVRETVSKMNENSENTDITDILHGYVGDGKATMYTLSRNGTQVFVITAEKGLWYYSENGEDYSVLDSKNCTVGDSVSIEFVIPTESEDPEETEPDGGMDNVSEESN